MMFDVTIYGVKNAESGTIFYITFKRLFKITSET